MSKVIADSRSTLVDLFGEFAKSVSEIVYADDIVIVNESGEFVQLYIDIIADHGKYTDVSI